MLLCMVVTGNSFSLGQGLAWKTEKNAVNQAHQAPLLMNVWVGDVYQRVGVAIS